MPPPAKCGYATVGDCIHCVKVGNTVTFTDIIVSQNFAKLSWYLAKFAAVKMGALLMIPFQGQKVRLSRLRSLSELQV